MEIEMEPRVKPLHFKIKGTSRESPSQKAAHLLDPDLRNHWSTGTNTKEWILLELDEPCLLSHIRIYNKSVLEWEISAGLRYKPEAFAKVRPRCEAPRRDMMYSTNYTPCRYVRLSCLRGNPIAVFFIQLIGLPITGLEPEFQPVVNHLMPQIISHKQDADDMHIQLLQDITSRLVPFLPHLEADLNSFVDSPELSIRFLAMLAGPFYPILHIVNEREKARLAGNTLDSEASKISQPSSALTVSSNFEPRRSRNMSAPFMSAASSTVFRPDAVFMLLRKAYKDAHLGAVCRMASRILLKLIEPLNLQQGSVVLLDTPPSPDEESKFEITNPPLCHDYSSLFGDDFQIPDDHFDASYLSVLDVGAVEEGVFHVLYSCASKPLLCSKLVDNTTNFWMALPLIQALLPALRPSISVADQVDDSFSQWKQPSVQYALSQIVATSSSLVYRPLLHACAGYLSSFSPSHAKAASVLIDLCSDVLAPWMTQVIAKVDLALELLEDLLGVIQGARHSITRPRAALKYIILALSGHMDDVMANYKDVKHRVLFLVEMLDPFLDPAITPIRSAIAFGNVSSVFQEKQEHNCSIALKILHAALKKSAVLPSLESEWMRGSVTPSVLLSILEPHMQFPAEIDQCTYASKSHEQDTVNVLPGPSVPRFGGTSLKYKDQDETDGRMDVHDSGAKIDTPEDASLFFAPSELRSMVLSSVSGSPDRKISDSRGGNISKEEKHVADNNVIDIDLCTHVTAEYPVEFFNLHADCLQLMNYQDCDMRATEFRRLASDLQSQHEINPESHAASIDALLLAAECYVNPLFMMSFRDLPEVVNTMKTRKGNAEKYDYAMLGSILKKNDNELETVAHLERRRDKIVLQILLEAAELDKNYQKTVPDGQLCAFYPEQDEVIINLSQHDSLSADAITLVRQNQALLCGFLVLRLQKGKHAMHEILLQSLLFLLQSATKLFCSPEHIIDIILGSAEYLHGLLTSYYHQCKEGKKKVDCGKVREVQRRWKLLQKLVIASSGGDDGVEFSVNTKIGFRFANLIPATAWIHKIPTFSSSASPLVRFLGWMAVSRNATLYTKEQVLLASDLSHITYLLSIFSDELALVDKIVQEKDEINRTEEPVKESTNIRMGFELPGQRHADQSFQAIYPDISWFFPDMRKEFEAFGEIILEAVGLELKSLSAGVLPDILCWFSDLCSWPFLQKETNQLLLQKYSECFKGFIAKNAKAIILYILEAIVTAHMEAMVPEIPRLVQVLVSLSRASYCDVSFLNSILQLLRPIISFSLRKVSDEEKLLVSDSCLNFESLCFSELFGNLSYPNEIGDTPADKTYSRALTIFILASVFPDLSFQRKRETVQSLMAWAEFATSEQTTYFHDYLSAFQTIMENCENLLFETLRSFSLVPLNVPVDSNVTCGVMSDSISGTHFTFISDVCEVPEEPGSENYDDIAEPQKVCHLSLEEAESFSGDLEGLISKLNPTVELCWKIHHQLAEKLTLTSVRCFVYLRCLSSVAHASSISTGVEDESNGTSKSVEGSVDHWRIALEELANRVMVLQEDHCWEVASVFLDCLLKAPQCFRLDSMVGSICSALNKFSCEGPKFSWRLQTDKWLSFLFARGIHSLHDSETPLVSFLSGMLGHLEPEQRFVALRHLGRLVGQDASSRTVSVFSTSRESPSVCFVSEPVLKFLVSKTWDHVVVVSLSDSSLHLRSRATLLLVDYIPFAERRQLQSLLASADSVLHNVGVFTPSKHDGPLAQISLALLASVCLHSPAEDISLIPQNVWRHIENQATSKTEGIPGNLQKQACEALFRLKHEGEDAKENLKEVLSGNSQEQPIPDFETTRESVLQVLANLTSVQSYFDLFSKNLDQKDMELEEAEMELDILQKEHMEQESCTDLTKWTHSQRDDRLQQIKSSIRSIEKAKLREEIIARRQKKLLMRRAHQKHLEETALREAELLHELDRERMIEAEREIERQQLLEQERAKTRELRHHIDMEKEKLAQRELQRELEQVESGIRPSRRDYTPSTHSNSRGRERERFRERDNVRPSNESSSRAMGGGSLHAETGGTGGNSTMPSVVLARSFSGHVPTILQSRDRFDDCGSNYDENFDGSKDSGDTGSIGDPELVSAFEGQSLGSSQRHGSRGSKSRQGTERRERDGRREGKWERKH